MFQRRDLIRRDGGSLGLLHGAFGAVGVSSLDAGASDGPSTSAEGSDDMVRTCSASGQNVQVIGL